MLNDNPYQSPNVPPDIAMRPPRPLWLPGIGVLAVSILTLIALPFIVFVAIPLEAQMEKSPVASWEFLAGIWQLFAALLGIAGSICMLRMTHRRMVLATAILACIPYVGIAGGCFTAPFGLIALMRLRRADVWHGFAH